MYGLVDAQVNFRMVGLMIIACFFSYVKSNKWHLIWLNFWNA